MKKVLNKRSNDTSGGYAKSPTTNNLEYGEIAVNYHDGVEKLFIKNDYNQIVSFPTDEQTTTAINTALADYTLSINIPVVKGGGVNSVQQKGSLANAKGNYSFAEGSLTKAEGMASHTEGRSTTATNATEHSEGSFNISNKASDNYGDAGNTQHSVGIGTSNNDKKNAHEIMQNGDHYIYGIGGYDGTNPGVARRIQDALMQCTGVKNIISLTKAEYDALANKDSDTIYVVEEYSHEYVDLGLRDGNEQKILFATCNIGASSPEEYGNYFAWGEASKRYTSISGSSVVGGSFTWSNCPYHTGDAYNTGWSKYIPTGKESYTVSGVADNKLTLETGDDVASVLWGGNWRMPDESNLGYLISSNVTYSWTDDYNGTGVHGYIITGKDSFSTASLFLPAAGGCSSTGLDDAGDYGNYWSRSVDSDYPSSACNLFFEDGDQLMGSSGRFYGLSVRPVHVGDVVPSYKLYKGSVPINNTYSKSEIDAKIGDIELILSTI